MGVQSQLSWADRYLGGIQDGHGSTVSHFHRQIPCTGDRKNTWRALNVCGSSATQVRSAGDWEAGCSEGGVTIGCVRRQTAAGVCTSIGRAASRQDARCRVGDDGVTQQRELGCETSFRGA